MGTPTSGDGGMSYFLRSLNLLFCVFVLFTLIKGANGEGFPTDAVLCLLLFVPVLVGLEALAVCVEKRKG